MAHAVAEQFVKGEIDTLSLMGRIGEVVKQDGFDVPITEEMLDGAIAYRDLGESLLAELQKDDRPARVENHLEKKVYAKSIDPRVWGTADRVIYRPGHILYVIDYKFGHGVVEAEDNEQGLTYVRAVMDTLAGEAFDRMEFIIHQPRASHVEGTVRRFVVTKEKLAEFVTRARVAAGETLQEAAPMRSGEWCKWCAVESTCAARHALVQAQAGVCFADAPPAAPQKMEDRLGEVRMLPDEKLVAAFAWEESVNSFFEAVKETLRERLTRGPVAGVKMVEGRSNRQWSDEKVAEEELKKQVAVDRLYTKKFVSPAQAEKIVGKGKIDHLTVKPEGKKSVALDRDPRPATSSSAADAFGGANALPQVWPQDQNVASLL